MLRKILAVIAGLIVGNLIIFTVESFSHMLYPLPEGITYKNADAFVKYVQELPIEAKILILFGYGLAAFSAGFISTKIGKNRKPYLAIICGAVFLAATVWNFTLLPTPVWMWFLGILMPFLALAGYKLALRKSTV